jgi:hypothetical protein
MHGSFLIRGPPVAFLNWNFQIDWPLFKIRLFSWLIDWKWKYLSLNHKKKKKKISTNKKNRVLDHPICPGFDYDMYYLWKKKKKNRWRDGRHRWQNPFYYVFIKTLLYIAIFYILWNIKHIS